MNDKKKVKTLYVCKYLSQKIYIPIYTYIKFKYKYKNISIDKITHVDF